LITAYPHIAQALIDKKITLYDRENARHSFLGNEIISSSELQKIQETILITPIYLPTREKMKELAHKWSRKIVDPYTTPNNLQVN